MRTVIKKALRDTKSENIPLLDLNIKKGIIDTAKSIIRYGCSSTEQSNINSVNKNRIVILVMDAKPQVSGP